ncbi:outer membrane beta-barrel protein [Methylomonas sp. HYX-M1]|uniref:outer membrane beta-barrel protein n=1 Tax=Methylomonas sp. HYX-M1 TaxID=3139307 RepID=UPI00345BFA25
MRFKRAPIGMTTLLMLAATVPTAVAGDWQMGAAIDLSYANAFQSGDRLAFRSKATTMRLNAFSPNMGMFYLRKLASENSRWGVDIGAHAGYDTDGQVPGSDRLPGYSILRYLSRANVSYLAPIGNGLSLTAGLMNSFIGFESLYAKDNFNYTRSWIADYSPYLLIGMGGQYAVARDLSVSLYLVSDYDYLAYRSDQPKYAGQLAWQFAPGWKLTQNLFAGPEQKQTDTANWRYFSDSIVQWSGEDVTVALAYDVGTERVVEQAGKQVLWMGSALFSRWHVDGPWSVALRPEIYWDGDGRLTGNRQLIKSVTATLEYKIPLDSAAIALRSEYRYDDSSGSQGGFFRYGGRDELIAGQHSVFLSCLFSFDRSF